MKDKDKCPICDHVHLTTDEPEIVYEDQVEPVFRMVFDIAPNGGCHYKVVNLKQDKYSMENVCLLSTNLQHEISALFTEAQSIITEMMQECFICGKIVPEQIAIQDASGDCICKECDEWEGK